MKKTLLIAAGLLSLMQAQAQQSHFRRNSSQNPKSAAIIRNILQSQAGNTAQKPTGTAQRVIAQASTYFSDTDTYHDSLKFSYSGTHGSRYSFNDIGYNEDFDPTYAPIYSDYRYRQSPLDLLADSIYTYSEGELTDLARAYYRADKKIDSSASFSFYMGTAEIYRKTKTSYSSGGALLQKVNLESNNYGASYDTMSYSHYTYNNDYTRVLADSNAYDPASGFFFGANRYIYSSGGRLDTVYSSGVLLGTETKSRMWLDYYSDGKLRKAVQQNMANNIWQTTHIDSLGYSANGEYFTYWVQQPYTNGIAAPEDYTLVRQFTGANGYPDSTLQYDWDANNSNWVAAAKGTYTYNTYNNPVHFASAIIEDSEETEEGYIDFYYELYNDEVSITPIAGNQDLRVYPNPFDNQITIDWKGKIQGDVTLRMVNMLGQEVYHSSRKLAAGVNTLNIPAIQNGNYVLLLQDAQGKTWSSKVVKR